MFWLGDSDEKYTTDEEYALGLAREDYIAGKLEVAPFEAAVEAILNGTDQRYTSPFQPMRTESVWQ